MLTETIERMLDALETPRVDLNCWERDFVDSVREQFAERGTLSDRQEEILTRIYEERG